MGQDAKKSRAGFLERGCEAVLGDGPVICVDSSIGLAFGAAGRSCVLHFLTKSSISSCPKLRCGSGCCARGGIGDGRDGRPVAVAFTAP